MIANKILKTCILFTLGLILSGCSNSWEDVMTHTAAGAGGAIAGYVAGNRSGAKKPQTITEEEVEVPERIIKLPRKKVKTIRYS